MIRSENRKRKSSVDLLPGGVKVTAYAADLGRLAEDEQAMRWAEMGLNERQITGLQHIAEQGNISRLGYARLTGVSAKTAYRDLGELVAKGLLTPKGSGRYVHYVLSDGVASASKIE